MMASLVTLTSSTNEMVVSPTRAFASTMSEEVIPFSAWDPEAVLASLAVEVDREGGGHEPN